MEKLNREDVEGGRIIAIAGDRIAEIIVNETRKISDMLELVRYIVTNSNSIEKNGMTEIINKAKDLKSEIEILRKDVLAYISKTYPALMNKEEWIRITAKVYSVSDKVLGIMYRLEYYITKGWQIDTRISSSILDLLDSLSIMVKTFIAMTSSLIVNPPHSLTLCEKIENLERDIDEKYRKTSFAILDTMKLLHQTILIKEIVDMLEDTSDIIEDTVSDFRLILLNKL
ncbi:MAG: hypothetical protein DRJ32_00910 [Thermoprotei archaeon]|nr:MAG: hypothetical protein DRJ32_00910 [Thermoprotei archaeon]